MEFYFSADLCHIPTFLFVWMNLCCFSSYFVGSVLPCVCYQLRFLPVFPYLGMIPNHLLPTLSLSSAPAAVEGVLVKGEAVTVRGNPRCSAGEGSCAAAVMLIYRSRSALHKYRQGIRTPCPSKTLH